MCAEVPPTFVVCAQTHHAHTKRERETTDSHCVLYARSHKPAVAGRYVVLHGADRAARRRHGVNNHRARDLVDRALRRHERYQVQEARERAVLVRRVSSTLFLCPPPSLSRPTSVARARDDAWPNKPRSTSRRGAPASPSRPTGVARGQTNRARLPSRGARYGLATIINTVLTLLLTCWRKGGADIKELDSMFGLYSFVYMCMGFAIVTGNPPWWWPDGATNRDRCDPTGEIWPQMEDLFITAFSISMGTVFCCCCAVCVAAAKGGD